MNIKFYFMKAMKKFFLMVFFAVGIFICRPHFAFAADATISGTVSSADGGSPIEDMGIYVTDAATDDFVTYAYSAADGTYSCAVAPGDYVVYNMTTTSDDPNVVFFVVTEEVTAGDGEVETVNFELDRRARLSGHVYDSDDTGLYDAYLYLNHVDGYTFGAAYEYSLVDGSYYLSPTPYTASDPASVTGLYNLYITKSGYFGRKLENITLASDNTTYTQDVTLTAASTVTGRVVNKQGQSLSGVTVTLRETDTGYNRTYTDVTNNNGRYTISVFDYYDYNGTAVGAYSLSTSKSGYVSKSISVSISADESALTDKNFTIAKGGKIAGTVYKSSNHTKMSGVTITADDGYGNTYSTTSADNGTYTLDNLRPSTQYIVTATKGNFVSQKKYNIKVTAGNKVTGKDFNLAASRKYSGTVTNKDGSKLDGVTVSLYRRSKVRSEIADYTATTDSNGNFSFTTIVPGNYRLKISKAGYLTYEKEKFGINQNKTGMSYALTPASSFYGRVTHDGGAVSGASLYIYLANESKNVGYAYAATDDNGYYRVGNLKAGSYKIKVVTTDYAQALVTKSLQAGTQVTADFALIEAGFISGYVTDHDTGLPLSGYPVKVKGSSLSATTDSNGYYIIDSLAAGNYKIYVSSSIYKTQYYGGTEDATGATSVTVTAGEITTGKNFSLFAK